MPSVVWNLSVLLLGWSVAGLMVGLFVGLLARGGREEDPHG